MKKMNDSMKDRIAHFLPSALCILSILKFFKNQQSNEISIKNKIEHSSKWEKIWVRQTQLFSPLGREED